MGPDMDSPLTRRNNYTANKTFDRNVESSGNAGVETQRIVKNRLFNQLPMSPMSMQI
jgi:hypothetical protein